MRCYTSLLSHVLGSHAQICGYLELHESYRSAFSLFYARCRIVDEGNPLGGRWVLDKILHNRCGIARDIVDREGVRFLLSIREPGPTLVSILRMYRLTGDGGSIEQACDYYTKRLTWLGEFGRSLSREKAMFFPGELLLDDPEQLLGQVGTFLGLRSAIQPTYQLFPDTGKRGKGDMSQRIKSGKILPPRKTQDSAIAEEFLAPARDAYETCLNALDHLRYREPTP